MNIINPIQQVMLNTKINDGIFQSEENNISFKYMLQNAINNVNELQISSQKSNEAFAMGLTDNIHQVMIASEKADMALQLTMQIRNKLLDAYHEIIRMPI